ncbi:hypothetical protein [Endozoicomonas sp. ALB032]|uniref:hypothetical protein n=1 Tax=Endozoicomonas sp. ALB032 TaxID=3403082 RepID=UPI003BB59117
MAACTADGTVSDIRAENVHISTSGDNAHAGIGAGVVDGGGMVTNAMAVNSTVETSGRSAGAGIGGGQVEKAGTVANIMAVNSHVTTSNYGSFAGIGGGWVEGTVANTTAVNSTVEASGEYALAGIGGGFVYGGGGGLGTVANTTAVNSRVTTSGNADAGIGAGQVEDGGMITNTKAVNSTVETSGEHAYAGIGGGIVGNKATVANTTAVNSKVETSGEYALAGIGGGFVYGGTVANTTAVNSNVTTASNYAHAGIGGGLVRDGVRARGTVANTTAVNSRVTTSGYEVFAGIGGGLVYEGTVANTTAVNSNVTTSGNYAHAGIGGGGVEVEGTVANTAAVNSHVTTSGYGSYANIGGGLLSRGTVAHTTAVDSFVNGNKKNSGSISNDQLFCQKADPWVLTANCSAQTEFLDALDLSYSDACPVGTYQQNATAAPTTATSLLAPCEILSGQTMGVLQRLNQYKDLVSGRQCIVLSADPADDLSELIKQIPDNTVILLSSETTSPTVAPVAGKTTVEYFISNAITLKNGQDIIGAADDGFEIVIKLHDNFTSRYMIGVGVHYYDEFNFGETADNHIKHITFQPTGVNPDTQTHAIVHTNCYYGALSIENNVFYLPDRAAVNINCSANLDASTSDLHTVPGLRFANNKVIGETIRTTKLSMIPERAIFINLPYINNLSNKLEIIGNTFEGRISELAYIEIGYGSNINIFRNTVDIDNKGETLSEILTGIESRRGGFALEGFRAPLHLVDHIKAPLINLAGNNINVTTTALTIDDKLDLALTCNHFQGMTLWKVDNEGFPLKAVDPLPLADECTRSVSSTVGPATTSAPTLCQIVNSWTPINDSKATALTGLTNVEGQFYFDSAVCTSEP